MIKLVIELSLWDTQVSGKILYQNEKLRSKGTKKLLFSSEKGKIVSLGRPDLFKNTLYIRGYDWGYDDNSFCQFYCL